MALVTLHSFGGANRESIDLFYFILAVAIVKSNSFFGHAIFLPFYFLCHEIVTYKKLVFSTKSIFHYPCPSTLAQPGAAGIYNIAILICTSLSNRKLGWIRGRQYQIDMIN